MTVKQLLEKLSSLPNGMEVVIEENKTEYGMGEIQSINVEIIAFHGGPENEPKPKMRCAVIRFE